MECRIQELGLRIHGKNRGVMQKQEAKSQATAERGARCRAPEKTKDSDPQPPMNKRNLSYSSDS